MTLLRADSYRRTRWKNGGGETREIAISPSGAGLDTFDWRISMATVAHDGPFSTFAGVDRTVCILDGAGIRLHINDEPARQLDQASEPFSFPGDAAAHSTLVDGAVTDFNVMTRRNRVHHSVQRLRLQAGETRDLPPDIRAAFCQSGDVLVEIAGVRARLEPLDTMLRDANDSGPWRLTVEGLATVCLISIVLA